MKASIAGSRRTRSYDRIEASTIRAIRDHGIEGVSIAPVMRDAGLTHGAFYAHFASREKLIVAAMEKIGRDDVALLIERAHLLQSGGVSPVRSIIQAVLSPENALGREGCGCFAILVSSCTRQSDATRSASLAGFEAFTRYLEQIIDGDAPRDAAKYIASAAVGAIQLARAANTTEQADAILDATRKYLLNQFV